MVSNPNNDSADDVPHRWQFVRLGGFDQVRLNSGEDLVAIEQLDQKLWAALSCPTRGLEFDSVTLDLIDQDDDEHIRAPEIISAIKWATGLLKNPDDLLLGAKALPLVAIDASTVEGKEILASAKQILANLGKADAQEITAEDTADTARIFAQTRFNGDGVITPDVAGDEETRQLIEDIMVCTGSVEDRSSIPGISQEKVDEFFQQAQAYSNWWMKAEANRGEFLPFDEGTTKAAAVFEAIAEKLTDFFTRCRLSEYDARAADPLNPAQHQYEALTRRLSGTDEDIVNFPLAKIEPGRPLPLKSGINPAWALMVEELRIELVVPMFGDKDVLTFNEWEILCRKFVAHEAWLAEKEGSAVESLGLRRVRKILEGDGRQAIELLLARDKALEPQANAIAFVDRLVRYYRDLYVLLNNFVSFRDFYRRDRKATFQAGTLYIDGRSCDLCVQVEDVTKHAAIAGLSRTYLVYCDCTRNNDRARISIAAGITGGDADNLMLGRNGVFYDRKGLDWDATIVKIVEHPISVRQAFWMPYKRVGRIIGEQIEKMAVAREKLVETAAASKAEAAPAKQPYDMARFAGIFAAFGLAIGAIGTAIASVVTGFLRLVWWQMPIAIIGLLLIISGPAMIIAYMKLRKRNLAPILDANGWAVNTRAMINVPFGASLTGVAKLPPGSKRSLRDPYSTKTKYWKILLFVFMVALAVTFLWQSGHIQKWWSLFGEEEAVLETPPAKGAAKALSH